MTDRLSLPQRIVVVIALALAFGVVGDYLPGFATTTVRVPESTSGGSPAYHSTLSVSLHTGLPGWLDLVMWVVLIAAWALLSVRILRDSAARA